MNGQMRNVFRELKTIKQSFQGSENESKMMDIYFYESKTGSHSYMSDSL